MSSPDPFDNNPDEGREPKPPDRSDGDFKNFHSPMSRKYAANTGPVSDTLTLTIDRALASNDFETAALEAVNFHRRFRREFKTPHSLELSELTTICQQACLGKDLASAHSVADYFDNVLAKSATISDLSIVRAYLMTAIVFDHWQETSRESHALFNVILSSDFSGEYERGYAAEAMVRLGILVLKTVLNEAHCEPVELAFPTFKEKIAFATSMFEWGKSLAEQNPNDLYELAEEAGEALERLRYL